MKEYSLINSRKIQEGLEKEKKSEIQNSQPLCKFKNKSFLPECKHGICRPSAALL